MNIAIFGDVMLDKYIVGDVDRISPEAPIPVVAVKEERYVPGGAANVAANIAALGGKAFLFGITGTGFAAEILISEAKKRDIVTSGIFKKENVHTIQKIRVIGQSQQLLRLDYESDNYSDVSTNGYFMDILYRIDNLKAIIVSDYAKGTINKELMENIREFSGKKNIPVFVDPKPANSNFYHHSFLITPNLKEAEGLCNMRLDNNEKIEKCGKFLMEKYDSNIVITRGAMGMSVFEKGRVPFHVPTKAKQVFDVSGAGDTVIATLCLSVLQGYSLLEAVDRANHAAGIKVSKFGTAPVTKEELEVEMNRKI